MNELTDFEKRLYNCYLASMAKANNRAYRRRQNFDKIKDEHYVALKKLSSLLLQSDVDIPMFFDAPYTIHTDEKYKTLQYYLTPNAIKCYTMLLNRRVKLDADSEENLEYVRTGMRFLLEYCLENNLTLDEYKLQMTENSIPMCLLHLKQHKINFYIIHALELQSELYKLGVDWLSFFITDFENVFRDTKAKFSKSTQLKPKATSVIGAIKNKLTQEKK